MKRIVRIAAITVGAILLLMLVTSLVASLLFDPNDYKDQISALVEQQTGRKLQIEGDLELTYFPWLGVKTGQISLSNAEGFGDQPFVSLKSANVRVKIWPLLLDQKVQAGAIILDGVILNLATDASGGNNWADLIAGEDAKTAEPGGTSTALEFEIEALRVRDSQIHFYEGGPELKYVLQGFSLETSTINPRDPIDLVSSFKLLTMEPQMGVEIDFSGTAHTDLENARYRIDEMSIAFSVEDGSHTTRAKGQIDAEILVDLEKSTFRADNGRLTASLFQPPVGPAEFDVGASWTTVLVDFENQTLEMSDFTADALDTKILVTARGDRIIDAPRFEGSIKIDDASLPNLITALAVELPEGVNASALGEMNLQAKFLVDPDAGTTRIENLTVDLLGMHLTGNITMDPEVVKGHLNIPRFQPSGLFAAIGPLVPDTLNARTLNALSLETNFTMNAGTDSLKLRNMKLGALGTYFNGNISIDNLKKSPVIAGSIRTKGLKPGNYAPLVAGLLPEGISPKQLGNIDLETAFKLETSRDRLELTGTQISVLRLTGTGNMVVSNLSASPSVEGDIKLSPFQPRALASRLKNPLPKTTDKKAFNKAELQTRFRASDTGATLDRLRVKLDETTANGSFEIRDFNNPAYTFALNIDSLNVDRYLPPETGNAAAAKSGKQADTQIPVALIRRLNVTGRARIGTLHVAKLKLQNIAVDISAAAGRVKLQPIRVTLYGGQFEGSVSVDAAGTEPAIAIDGAINRLFLGATMKAYTGDLGPVTGTGAFKVDLSGHGQTVEQNLLTATGQVNFQIDKGELRGFNLEYELCRAYNTLVGARRPSGNIPEATKFNQIKGTSSVKDGIATSRDLLATTSFLKVAGRGKLSLQERWLDYSVDATMTDKVKLQGCEQLGSLVGMSVPVKITGTIEEPTVLPDFGKIAGEIVKDKLKDSLFDLLGGH